MKFQNMTGQVLKEKKIALKYRCGKDQKAGWLNVFGLVYLWYHLQAILMLCLIKIFIHFIVYKRIIFTELFLLFL